MLSLIIRFYILAYREKTENIEIRKLVANVDLHHYDWWIRMIRNNNNQAVAQNEIVEEETLPDWEDDIIDIKNDTDGSSMTELTIMIWNEIILNTKDKYFERKMGVEISAIRFQNKSDESVLIESEESI